VLAENLAQQALRSAAVASVSCFLRASKQDITVRLNIHLALLLVPIILYIVRQQSNEWGKQLRAGLPGKLVKNTPVLDTTSSPKPPLMASHVALENLNPLTRSMI
jgi:hypothetical protein